MLAIGACTERGTVARVRRGLTRSVAGWTSAIQARDWIAVPVPHQARSLAAASRNASSIAIGCSPNMSVVALASSTNGLVN